MKTASSPLPSSTILCATSCSLPSTERGAALNGKRFMYLASTRWPRPCWPPDSPAASATTARTSLLPRVHSALARCPPRRLGRTRPGVRRLRPLGRILGIQPQSLGYRCRNSSRRRGRRPRHQLLRHACSPQPAMRSSPPTASSSGTRQGSSKTVRRPQPRAHSYPARVRGAPRRTGRCQRLDQSSLIECSGSSAP